MANSTSSSPSATESRPTLIRACELAELREKGSVVNGGVNLDHFGGATGALERGSRLPTLDASGWRPSPAQNSTTSSECAGTREKSCLDDSGTTSPGSRLHGHADGLVQRYPVRVDLVALGHTDASRVEALVPPGHARMLGERP